MDSRELCLPGNIAQTYNMLYVFKDNRLNMYDITVDTTELYMIIWINAH